MKEMVKKRETIKKNTIILQYLFEGSIWTKEYCSNEAIVMPRQKIMKPFENKDILYIAWIGYL
jgi:hypothetical protein